MHTYAREITDTSLLADDMLAVLPASLAVQARAKWLRIANETQERFVDARGAQRNPTADAWLKELSQPFANNSLPFDISASDGDIIEYARALALKFERLGYKHNKTFTGRNQLDFGALFTVAGQFIDVMSVFIKDAHHHYGIDAVAALLNECPPDENTPFFKSRNHTPSSIASRFVSATFWVRQMRRMASRELETIIRNQLGFVHRGRQLYVSDEQLRRREEQRHRNTEMMKYKIIINELGEDFRLDEVVAKTNANPAVRRAELMVRIAGFEHMAKELEHVGEFITLTCPSRFHVRSAAKGYKNNKFDGSTPSDAQDYLNKVWARIGTHLSREKIKIYGFRVTEPHHDGCPHWHGLFFMPKESRRRFRQIVAQHGCRADRLELKLFYHQTRQEAVAVARALWVSHCKMAEETNAKKPTLASVIAKQKCEAEVWREADYKLFGQVSARVTFKAIDWNKGSAAGYIAKYIAKNIDGKNTNDKSVGWDYEAAESTGVDVTAKRVDAWAATWRIRQFQQIGGAPVSIWRELRRLKIETYQDGDIIERAAMAADKGDWGKFTELMGGINYSRSNSPITLYKEDLDTINAYGEPRAAAVQGVLATATGELLYSRDHVWTIAFKERELKTDENGTKYYEKDADGKPIPLTPNQLIRIYKPSEVLGFERGDSPAWTRVNNSTNHRNNQKHFTDQLAAAIVTQNKENRRHFNKEQISELVEWVVKNSQVIDYENINNAAAVLMYADAMVEMGETALLNKYESFEHFKNAAKQEVRIFKESLKPVDIHIAEFDMANTQVEIDRLKNEIAEIEAQAYSEAVDPIARMMRRAGRNIDLSRQGIAAINTKQEETTPTVAELQAEYTKARAEKRRRTQGRTLADQLKETRNLIARMQSRTMQ